MANDELQFAISQYHDGSLPAEERAEVEAMLERDGEARALLAEYRALDRMLKGLPVPEVRWDQLAEQISGALDERDEQMGRRYSLSWVRLAPRLAMAASVLLAIGVGVLVYRSHEQGARTARESVAITQIKVLQSEKMSGPAVNEVQIGPSAVALQSSGRWFSADDVISRPSQVTIARNGPVAQDDEGLPY